MFPVLIISPRPEEIVPDFEEQGALVYHLSSLEDGQEVLQSVSRLVLPHPVVIWDVSILSSSPGLVLQMLERINLLVLLSSTDFFTTRTLSRFQTVHKTPSGDLKGFLKYPPHVPALIYQTANKPCQKKFLKLLGVEYAGITD